MRLDEYVTYDGLGLADLVRRRQVSAAELQRVALAAIEAANPKVNAVVTLAPEAPGEAPAGPFGGVPFLIKELVIHAAGVPFNSGSRLAQGVAAPYDTELMSRFRRAGLVLLGTTSTPEFGFNATTEPVLHGPTRNPWDLSRSPGGSSGGSAAAVAAGMVPVAHANDGGGSIRIPAACCGLVGLKPTRHRIPFGPDHGEPLNGMAIEFAVTRSVRDAAALLDAVAGPDPGAAGMAPRPARPWLEETSRDPKRLRIAWNARPLSGAPIDPECVAAAERTARLLADLGHEVFEAGPAVEWEPFLAANEVVWTANLAHWIDALAQMLGRVADDSVLETGIAACWRRGRELRADELLAALDVVNRASRICGTFFLDCDVLLTPTVSRPPPPLGMLNSNAPGLTAGEWTRQVFDYSPFTPLWNATGQPALSLPLAWSAEGLPIGMQFIGRFGDESTLFALAGQLERAQPWASHRAPLVRSLGGTEP